MLKSRYGKVRYAGGSFTTIDVPGGSDTMAFGINNAGDIVGGFNNAVGGGHGFLYTGGNFTTIDVPGSTGTNAHGINDIGQSWRHPLRLHWRGVEAAIESDT